MINSERKGTNVIGSDSETCCFELWPLLLHQVGTFDINTYFKFFYTKRIAPYRVSSFFWRHSLVVIFKIRSYIIFRFYYFSFTSRRERGRRFYFPFERWKISFSAYREHEPYLFIYFFLNIKMNIIDQFDSCLSVCKSHKICFKINFGRGEKKKGTTSAL